MLKQIISEQATNKEKGMTLIEVMAALTLFCLMAVSLLSFFTTSSMWIVSGAKKTQATEYATSIIETLKAYSSNLDLNEISNLQPQHWDSKEDNHFELIDEDTEDGFFYIKLKESKDAFKVKAPPGMTASLNLSQHDDSVFYDKDDDGYEDFTRYINNNLFNVLVTVTWTEAGHSRQFQMYTVVSAR